MDPDQDLMMRIMGAHEMGGPIEANMEDPEAIWDQLRQRFNLTDEQVEELRMVAPEGGPGLAERLQRRQPQMSLGPLDLTLDGSLKEPRIEGSVRF